MKTNLACHKTKVIDGVCGFLLSSSVSQFQSKENRSLVREGDHLMSDSQKLAETLGLEPTVWMKIMGQLDIR